MRTELGDFTVRPRTLTITALALVVGGAGVVTAFALLRLPTCLPTCLPTAPDIRVYVRRLAAIGVRRPVRRQGCIPVGVTPSGLWAVGCDTKRNAGAAALVRS
jgi:hypothetical protein